MTSAAPVERVEADTGRWEGRDVTMGEVSQRLAEMRHPANGGEPLTLASTLTLVAVAPHQEDVAEMEAVLRQLADHQPSRAVLLTLGDGDHPGLDAAIDSARRPGGEDRCLWVERVTLTLHGASPEAAASAVVPLLRFDLPTFLWWPTAPDPGAHPLLRALSGLAGRLVSEAGRSPNARRAVGHLARWCSPARPAPTDLSWAALTPWRQLLAQLIDDDALATLRAGAAGATLRHPGPEPSVEALLMGGWLRDVLGERTEIALQRAADGGSDGGLLALELAKPGGRTLSVERTPGRDTAEVVVTEADGRPRARVLPLPRAGRAALLSGELELHRADRPFERALPHAVRLAERS